MTFSKRILCIMIIGLLAYQTRAGAQPVQNPAPSPTGTQLFPSAGNDLDPLFQVPPMLSSYLGPSVRVDRVFTTSRTVLTPQTLTTTQTVPGPLLSGGRRGPSTTITTTQTINVPQTVIDRKTRSYRIPEANGGFRISDDESPLPQTRAKFDFNYWDPLYIDANRRLGDNASVNRAFRETLGLEYAFLDNNASVGLRVPVNTLKVNGNVPGIGGDDTSIGDLFLISKVLLYHCEETGNAISAGLALTVPTGPRTFAGADGGLFPPSHGVRFQPYVGYLWRPTDRLFLHGFSAVDIPTDDKDVLLAYNDLGIGWFAYRSDCWLTSVVPTVEVRVTTPLNHNGILNAGVFGETNVLEGLAGVTFTINKRFTLAVGGSVPLTGPKPYDWQVLTQLNFRF